MGSTEEIDDLIIARLQKTPIPAANGTERLRLFDGDDLVGDLTEFVNRGPRCDRNGEDDPTRTQAPGREERSGRGDTRGKAVVDEHDVTIGEIRKWPTLAIAVDPTGQFDLFVFSPGLEIGHVESELSQRQRIAESDPAFGDGTDSELRISGSTDFAHDEHVEGLTEMVGDFGSHGHTAPWQCEDHRI